MKPVLLFIFFQSFFMLAQPYLVQDVNPSTNYPGVLTISGAEYNDWYYYAGEGKTGVSAFYTFIVFV
jgi:hypothetical protein